MAVAVKFFRFCPRLFLALSVLLTGLIAMAPVPAQAQSMIERLFGRPTVAHQRKIRQAAPRQTYKRKVIRKRTVTRRAPTRSYSKQKNRGASSGSKSASSASSYTYRTLCVRKADGYFFPVSFSTTSDYFDRDLEACEARCPGTDVDLYFHRVLREEAEQMVSHSSGNDYTDLETAFVYKTKGIDAAAAKACEIKPDLKPIITVAENLGDLPFESPIPLPIRRPDPEMLLISDLRGGEAEMAEVQGRPKVIRRVGPRFFPDQ